MKLWIITLQVQLKKQNKQTSKQNNLLTLTVSCERKSCLIRRKKKKTIIKMIIKRKKRKEKEIKKLIKMTMEAIILMIS